ncbi:phosphatidylinositol N-acetylglucosaminyltransferase subunit Y, partial [Dimargaris cristalligena]
DSAPDTTRAWGYVLLIATFVFFALGLYTTTISKFMPVTGNRLLDAIREDQYYCLLAPLTLTVAFYTLIWNWLGMKIFRHN